MRKILSHIHILGGLLFFPLMIIFGLSAVHINHRLSFLEPKGDWQESASHISITDNQDKQIMAENIRDSLGLMGYCPPWTQNRKDGRYSFDIAHNGADYRIEADLATGDVRVKRKPRGFGSIFNSLHFFNESLPSGNMIVNSWQFYKDAAFIYLVVAVLSSIWLIASGKRRHRKAVLAVLISSVIITALLIILVR